MRVQDRILLIDAYGPWNREAAVYFGRELRRNVREHIGKNEWGMIAFIHGDGLYTPDALEILKELHVWRIDNGLRRVAIVHDTNTASQVTENQFNRVYVLLVIGHWCY